jgi:hypothetical protein
VSKDKPQPKDKPVVVSDATLRRLIEKKGRIFTAPKEPVKSA